MNSGFYSFFSQSRNIAAKLLFINTRISILINALETKHLTTVQFMERNELPLL